MTTLTLTRPNPVAQFPLPYFVSDAFAIAWRILIRVVRSPEELASASSTPVIFLLLFRYVFGGAINVGSTGYANYVIAGILVQAVAISALAAGTGIAQDLQSGLIDRFRSLPIAQSAVLSGRVAATMVRSLITLAIVAGVGIGVGFRPLLNPDRLLLGLALLMLFGLALSWVGIAIGLLVKNPEAVQNTTMTLVFPLTFLSSAFVPTQTMPILLRAFASSQPMTQVVDALRDLSLGQQAGSTAPAVVWSVLIVALFAPLSIWAYGRATAR